LQAITEDDGKTATGNDLKQELQQAAVQTAWDNRDTIAKTAYDNRETVGRAAYDNREVIMNMQQPQ